MMMMMMMKFKATAVTSFRYIAAASRSPLEVH